MINEKTYICSKEQYLKFKDRQKDIALSEKNKKIEYRKYIAARRKFYHEKGMTIPSSPYVYKHYDVVNVDKEAGFNYEIPVWHSYDPYEPRYFNVIYGLCKGKAYSSIENKVRDGNQIDLYRMEKFCKKYGVDYSKVKDLIWQTTSNK